MTNPTILVTGGYGFIGGNFIRWLRNNSLYNGSKIVVLDSRTYAANPEQLYQAPGIIEERIDIRDQADVGRVIKLHQPEMCFHFAAETHVCRSIAGPKRFVTTNVMGTFNLLEEWRDAFSCDKQRPFIHISTDEVFGQLGAADEPFTELSPVKPRSPYAASKAASDLLALSYWETYGMPVKVTNCSNNFGPWQHEEKLIPATITALLSGQPPKAFGNGSNVRDWLFVRDHCEAIMFVLTAGGNGERYCIGGDAEFTNLQIIEKVTEAMVRLKALSSHAAHQLKPVLVPDARPTDDARYAINSAKMAELGWQPRRQGFAKNLLETVAWYTARWKAKACAQL